MAPARSKTRAGMKAATGKAAPEVLAVTTSTTQKVSLPKESSNPPKQFILPANVCQDARILSILNPQSASPSRYLYCSQNGFFEFIRVGAPKTTPRSILLSPAAPGSSISNDNDPDVSKGYITKSADLFVATPIDPLFLILPALSPTTSKITSEPQKQLFLTLDDHLDNVSERSTHLTPLLAEHKSLSSLFELRIESVCDMVDAGDESMYRLSQSKLFGVLLGKAQKLVSVGLPASMEESLIRKALEAPMLGLKRDESSLDIAEDEESQSTTPSTILDSQSSTATLISEASTSMTSVDGAADSDPVKISDPPISAPEGVVALLRLRTAFSFIVSSYLPPHLASNMQSLLSSSDCSPDFTPLDKHLTHIASLRQQAMVLRETTSFNRKRGFEDDEEAEARAEKKRKKEEEEKKAKANMSRGVRDLAKVNVKGMKKMSDFFTKKKS